MDNSPQSENQLPLLDAIFKFPVPIQDWEHPAFLDANIKVQVYRADRVHPWIHGNKAWKLRHLTTSSQYQNALSWISMGGPFSNHLLALSCLANALRKPLKVFIRGQATEWQNNPWIRQMQIFGTEVLPISRTDYRLLHLRPESWRQFLPDEDPETPFIPLGGSSPEVLVSMQDWAARIQAQVQADFWCLPVGTGGTCVGLASGLTNGTRVLAIEAVRIPGGMEADVRNRVPVQDLRVWERICWVPDYVGGGFGKSNPELEAFCSEQTALHGFPLEPVYSGKAFLAVSDLARKGYFPPGSRLLLIHTGGVYPWNSGHFLPE
jgi:1-aminocyclopropane-1-carboxylate deaminase